MLKKTCHKIVNSLVVLLFFCKLNKMKSVKIVQKAFCATRKLRDLTAGWTGQMIGSFWSDSLNNIFSLVL